MMRKKDDIYYGREDEEILTCESKEEFVNRFLNLSNEIPNKLEVCKYIREIVPKSFLSADRLVEYVIEELDERYGMEEPSESTPKMEEAAKKFIEVVLDEYVPWVCKIKEKEEINLREWIENGEMEK